MSRKIEMVGKRFGHLVVLEEAGRSKQGAKRWKCQCDCGSFSTPCGSALRFGRIKACRCRTGKKFNKKECDAAYRKSNRKQIALKDAEYRKTHAVQKAAYRKEYDKTHAAQRAAYLKANQKQFALKAAEYSKNNATQIAAYKKAYSKANALYDTHISSISWAEKGKTRRDPSNHEELQVKCSLCGSWFTPTNRQVNSRVGSINGYIGGDNNFYCSEDCKIACPVFHQIKYRKGDAPARSAKRTGQKEWRDHVIICAEFSCEKCGKVLDEKDLSAHHIKSVSQHPILSMDIDNGMALCKDCHKVVHSEVGCRPVDLRCQT